MKEGHKKNRAPARVSSVKNLRAMKPFIWTRRQVCDGLITQWSLCELRGMGVQLKAEVAVTAYDIAIAGRKVAAEQLRHARSVLRG